ncbi:MAG: nucleoside-diphosphate sugar epimerase [Sphingobacteriaceae bacterium]
MDSKKIKQHIVEFDSLETHADLICGDVVFSCIGSTKAKTPDLTVYKKIDHDYSLKVAEIAIKNGMAQFHLISAIGANCTSSNFYLSMKGETEDDLKKIPFQSIYIYQPALLDGDRKEQRILETIAVKMMRVINPLLLGKLSVYRSIKVTDIASAMINASIENNTGIFVYPTDKIKTLA